MTLGVSAVVRRSTRARAAPEVYRPAWVASEQGYVNSVDSDVEETREGEDYQAVLPEVRPRPARTPAEEQIWMQPPILTGKGYFKRCNGLLVCNCEVRGKIVMYRKILIQTELCQESYISQFAHSADLLQCIVTSLNENQRRGKMCRLCIQS